MELSMTMLTPPKVSAQSTKASFYAGTSNKEVRRRVDMYFTSNRKPKYRINSNWRSPEEDLAELFENLPEVGHPVSLNMELPYYLYGVLYKTDETPGDAVSRRKCIELQIDGENVVVESEGSKLVVIDHRHGLKYELLDSFRSKILC